MERPEYLDWLKETQKNPEIDETELEDEEAEEAWDYFTHFEEFPPEDAPEETIRSFMEDAKEAEKALKKDLISDKGYSEAKADYVACQWPLRDDAPMKIIRNYIGCQYELQEAAKQGIDL